MSYASILYYWSSEYANSVLQVVHMLRVPVLSCVTDNTCIYDDTLYCVIFFFFIQQTTRHSIALNMLG